MHEPINYQLAKELVETGIFEYCYGQAHPTLYVFLKETNFRYDTFNLHWNRMSIRGYDGNVSFEEVLEQVSPEIQAKLLFHLDLLR